MTTMTNEERLEKLEGLLGQALGRIDKLENNREAIPPNCPGTDDCSYNVYLAYGEPGEPNLEHRAYHAAERACLLAQERYDRHDQSCVDCSAGRPCRRAEALHQRCLEWERRIRA